MHRSAGSTQSGHSINCCVKPTGTEGERIGAAGHVPGGVRPGHKAGVPCRRWQMGMNALTQSEVEHGQTPTSWRIWEWMEIGDALRQPCLSGERARRGRTPDKEDRARRGAENHKETEQVCELSGAAGKLLGIPLKTSRMVTLDDCAHDKLVCRRRRRTECDGPRDTFCNVCANNWTEVLRSYTVFSSCVC